MASVLPTIGADAGNTHFFDAMYVPVAGPFITAGQAFGQSGGPFGYFGFLVGSLFVADGVVQAAGTALLVYGLASPRKIFVHDAPRFSVTPVVGKGMTGVGAAFTF